MLTIKSKVDQVLKIILITILAIMVFNVTWQVISRYILGTPSLFTDELSTFLLIWLGLLGAAYMVGQNGHMAIDLISQKLSITARNRVQQLISILIIAFSMLVMVYGGIKLVLLTLSLGQLSPTLNIPLGYVYTVLPISGALSVFYVICNFKLKV